MYIIAMNRTKNNAQAFSRRWKRVEAVETGEMLRMKDREKYLLVGKLCSSKGRRRHSGADDTDSPVRNTWQKLVSLTK
ncbi:MAG: hypothetical protein A2350_13075 [Candidatus Raymondbacteria bacterium RifOxyB12_full_50_8]|uniref:Uncharacterized protein n=1 Tax=Candidatus Raymondbacteria bacterium RIFOXYD12_FULL_49_13 TaxID=1817890 RepID=A0A1F7F0A1_UNCRA|nr:MAG: hypothetical protein A2248_21840 [Candidatus Raymondbacteria bacterium RIFOXYA2_FULL_49_16]OGK00080.1 MAG: hypothetical protein A2519_22395 [Candidatus Raymondbacteria bacterium RIFOXYD12_FULL_49_13]OGK03696.1 MAG: hypothetical protein A2350_13075 [Candidatus Raymondbacteria bacterium RifOxyB12_full_50_8]OGP45069.1 MAG: hypothetical protein A2324_13720 [Candidatus Raymondbacteria bacterium RIFOXYB2_FULL_49_35]